MLFTTGYYSLVTVSAVLSVLLQVVQSTSVLPVERTTGQGCIPEGRTVSYQCTVTDPLDPPVASTIWLGTAFSCPSVISAANNRITLVHNQFEPDGTNGVCNGLSAMSVGVNGRNYTSRLTLTTTTGLNGTTVECSLSGVVVIGIDTIRVGVPVSPPTNIEVESTSISSLTVSWIPPSDTSNVGEYILAVAGRDCGGCVSSNVNASTTNVICSGWMANDQTCSFEVATVSHDCGITSSTVELTINLVVPLSPTRVSVNTLYNEFGSTEYVDISFMGISTSPLGGNLDPTINYTVVFTGTRRTFRFTGVVCNATNYCTVRVEGSELSLTDRYTVSVVAANLFGQGPATVVSNQIRVCLIECDPEVLGPSPTRSRNGPGRVGVANGMVTYNGVTSGSVATLSCDTGSSVANNYTRTCMSDGHWSEGTLNCVPLSDNALSFGGSIALSIVLTFVFTLVVGVFIGVLSVLVVNKWRRSERITLQTETEKRPPPAIYEEPEDFKPDPQTQGNMAYEIVQR